MNKTWELSLDDVMISVGRTKALDGTAVGTGPQQDWHESRQVPDFKINLRFAVLVLLCGSIVFNLFLASHILDDGLELLLEQQVAAT